jgi:hypothetical protein
MVPLKWGRDSDVVEELAATSRRTGGQSPIIAGTAAPAMIGFSSSSAREREEREIQGMAGGEDVCLGADAAAQRQRTAAAGQPPGSADSTGVW